MHRPYFSLRPFVAGSVSVGLLSSVLIVHLVTNGTGSRKSTPFSMIQSVSDSRVVVGDAAPAITWQDAASGKTIHLSDLAGKPVVLYSGSYTCPPFRVAAGMIEGIAAQYRGRVHSFLVYSREAHPFIGTREYTRHPATIEDREKAARDLIADSGLTMPVLIDQLDNKVEKVCGSIPSRILVIDSAGKVAYLSGDPGSNMAMPIPGILDRLLAGEDPSSAGKPKELPSIDP